jgi:hypothetical protein
MLCCATLSHTICCVVVVANGAAIDSSSALHLARLTAARDEREWADTP